MSPTSDASDRTPAAAQFDALRAIVVEYDDAPDECTVYPAGATGDALVTRWVTAREGSFVTRHDAR